MSAYDTVMYSYAPIAEMAFSNLQTVFNTLYGHQI